MASKRLKSKPKKTQESRELPSTRLIESMAREIKMAKLRSHELSGGLGQSLKDAKARGINVAMLKLATKFVGSAENDPLKAAVNKEDFDYYLQTLGFDKKIAPSMFKASETRSSKKGAPPISDPKIEAPIQLVEEETALAVH